MDSVVTEPANASPLDRRTRWGWTIAVLGLIAALGLTIVASFRVQRTMADDRRRLVDFLDAVEARLAAVPLLRDREHRMLRRSLNARHLQLAERLGIEPLPDRAAIDSVAASLVDLTARNPAYRAQRATFSVPLGTPGLAAMLDTLALALRARTDEAGLPPVGFVLTSTLRTESDQAALRGVNVNAARGHSSHEYATTVDIHSERFESLGLGALRPPRASESLPRFIQRRATADLRRRAESGVEQLVARYPARYLALLGRTLITLEDEGLLVTVLERRQPVFHTTVARRF